MTPKKMCEVAAIARKTLLEGETVEHCRMLVAELQKESHKKQLSTACYSPSTSAMSYRNEVSGSSSDRNKTHDIAAERAVGPDSGAVAPDLNVAADDGSESEGSQKTLRLGEI